MVLYSYNSERKAVRTNTCAKDQLYRESYDQPSKAPQYVPWCLPCAAFQLSATHHRRSESAAQREASLQAVVLTGVAELVEVEARGAHDLVASGLCKSFCEALRQQELL